MDRLEAGVYQPVTCTLSAILREYLAKVTPAKKSHLSEARRLNRLLKDPIASYRVCDLSPPLFLTEPLLIAFWRWKFGYRCRDENSQYKRCRSSPFIRQYHKHRKEQAHEHNKKIVVAIAFEFMVKLVKHLVSYFLPAFMASIFICLSASCSISRWALAVLDWPKMPSNSMWQ